MDAEFRTDNDLVAEGLECRADKLFVVVRIVRRAVNFRRVKKRVTDVDRLREKFNHFFVGGRTVSVAHSHATKSDCRNGKIFSERAMLNSKPSNILFPEIYRVVNPTLSNCSFAKTEAKIFIAPSL